MSWALSALMAALFVTASAQVAFKQYSNGAGRGYLVLTVMLFASAPPLTYLAVKAYGVGTVYVSTAITYILVALAGWRLFGESPTPRRVLAMGLILLGVLIYAVGL
ncbi:DMT family transporter [Marilutibacter maris]|uniref:EamA family transporter n=1 Tax=Marilutibacter maris TaxID=1605891 RepID=UPI000DA746C7|nr:EamA family transporter [Lysobacter maris]